MGLLTGYLTHTHPRDPRLRQTRYGVVSSHTLGSLAHLYSQCYYPFSQSPVHAVTHTHMMRPLPLHLKCSASLEERSEVSGKGPGAVPGPVCAANLCAPPPQGPGFLLIPVCCSPRALLTDLGVSGESCALGRLMRWCRSSCCGCFSFCGLPLHTQQGLHC